jgi:uncharacterized membrane protein required for colicin V production
MRCATVDSAAPIDHMNEISADTLKYAYLGGSGLVAGLLAWNGWRQGVARQGMTLLAVASAYAAGFFGRKTAMPAFEFLGYPELITEIIGGIAAGILTYIAVNALSRMLFKKRKELPEAGSRMRSGIFGAILGFVFGVFLFAVSYFAVRMMGTIASSKMHLVKAAEEEAKRHPKTGQGVFAQEEPNALISGLAKLNGALNEGQTGEFFHKVDRVPPNVYATLFKLGIMVASEEAVERFLSYPGVATLSQHPKLTTLTHDPTVASLLSTKSYLKLLKNDKVVALANDVEFAKEIKAMDFEKALDHAIKGGALPPDAGLATEKK